METNLLDIIHKRDCLLRTGPAQGGVYHVLQIALVHDFVSESESAGQNAVEKHLSRRGVIEVAVLERVIGIFATIRYIDGIGANLDELAQTDHTQIMCEHHFIEVIEYAHLGIYGLQIAITCAVGLFLHTCEVVAS